MKTPYHQQTITFRNHAARERRPNRKDPGGWRCGVPVVFIYLLIVFEQDNIHLLLLGLANSITFLCGWRKCWVH
jgi:hypothetical protein